MLCLTVFSLIKHGNKWFYIFLTVYFITLNGEEKFSI